MAEKHFLGLYSGKAKEAPITDTLLISSVEGNTSSAGSLTLISTSNATKGKIFFGLANTSFFDEANNFLKISSPALGATILNVNSGIYLVNPTAAISGTQQESPSTTWEGKGFGTTAGTSQVVQFVAAAFPAQGTVPTGSWLLASQINGASLVSRMSIASNGLLIGTTTAGLFITDNVAQGGINFASQSVSAGRFRTTNNWIFEALSGSSAAINTWVFTYPSITATTGTSNFMLHNASTGFAPTSGTAVFNNFQIADIINQTGGANGITRGLYVNPTLTAAADYRAIECVAGRSVFSNGFVHKRTTVSDTNYTVLITDYIIAYITLTATRQVTLPTTNMIIGQTFIIKDEAGTALTNNITFVGTIDGSTTAKIITNFGIMRVYWNGTNYSTF